MSLTRREDWPERLHAAVEAGRTTFFAWGRMDCLMWAADAVLAMTGFDLAADFRGTYDDEMGALRALRDYAGGGLPEACDKIAADHGLERVEWQLAQRGDAVLIAAPGTPAGLGIVIGAQVAGVSQMRFGFLPTGLAIAAWRI